MKSVAAIKAQLERLTSRPRPDLARRLYRITRKKTPLAALINQACRELTAEKKAAAAVHVGDFVRTLLSEVEGSAIGGHLVTGRVNQLYIERPGVKEWLIEIYPDERTKITRADGKVYVTRLEHALTKTTALDALAS